MVGWVGGIKTGWVGYCLFPSTIRTFLEKQIIKCILLLFIIIIIIIITNIRILPYQEDYKTIKHGILVGNRTRQDCPASRQNYRHYWRK